MTSFTSTLATDVVEEHLVRAIHAAAPSDEPFRHWILSDVFDPDVVTALLDLPFVAPRIEQSGTREVNNHSRQYFAPANIMALPVMRLVADVFQRRALTAAIEQAFDVRLADSFLRIEYAMDTDGFWLAPHTDLGVKRFTMLTYISRAPEVHHGTDLYFSKDRHCKAVDFASNTALVFVPSTVTWHGLEPHAMSGVRKSIIINYVDRSWRSREQLSFPDRPVC